VGTDGVGVCAGLDLFTIVLDGVGIGVRASLGPFVVVLACCSFDSLAFRGVGLFVLAVDGIGARGGVLRLMPLVFMLAAGSVGVTHWRVVCLICWSIRACSR
jgi:hypothetical protein